MSEYIRTTRECSVNELHPEILQAIQNYFQEHALGHLPSETLACCETISQKKAGKTVSWLSGKQDTTIYTAVLLTSELLIWVHYGNQSGIRLNTANLKEIGSGYRTSLLTKDVGLEIVGYIGNAKGRVRGYIAMGTDLAAQNFCEEVQQAVTKANPPSPRKPFRWLSGG
jgi:hypothetical protein